MKKAILFLTLCAAIAAAQTSPEKKAQPKASAKTVQKSVPAAASAKPAPPVVQLLAIPKEAVAQTDGTFKYTDKGGKRWVFSNTFFGVSRMEDMSDPSAPPPVKQAAAFDNFRDDGEVVHFERKTPFGPLQWERKKAELTDEERTAIAAFKPAVKK